MSKLNMGITGLIPFLEKSSRQINISQYSGCTVAIDTYCWLHKGAFSCADKLARGDKTDAYVTYCMKFVNMLLSHNIKPILVFDGRHLPAKSDTEKKRRQNREVNRRRAAELLRQDKPNEARTFLQRCVDVTHTMAVELMRECRNRNVDCITAPYEADAQLAYLNISNIAHVVITEDSDLLLFGCTKVIFKLDLNGNGLLVDQDNLHLAMGISKGLFSLDKFRQMCILSGCDYLPSLPKIGLVKACRFIKSTVDPDIHRALSRLGGHLNMNIVVPVEYRNKFVEAEAMFRHQPVFDPLTRRLVPLTPLPPGESPLPLLARETLTSEQLFHLALGNLDPFTLKRVDEWTPEKAQATGGRTNSWQMKSIATHKSIWSRDYKPRALVIHKPDPCDVKRSSTSGKVVEHSADIPKLPAKKRPLQSMKEELSEMHALFAESPQPSKKPRCEEEDILDILEKSDHTPPKSDIIDAELLESPKKVHGNPFAKTLSSGNKFSGLSKLAQCRRTTVSDTNIVQSRYFGGNGNTEPDSGKSTPSNNTLKDVSNTMEAKGTKQPSRTPSTHAVISDKLSDSSISSLFDGNTDDNDEILNNEKDSAKENDSFDNVQSKHENTFRWKPSLKDMFGFKSNSLPSSPAVRKDFVKPLKDEESKSCGRNPFAKAKMTKVEEFPSTLGSQGSVLSSDSEILTPETTSSQESSASSISLTPRSHVKVGLSKKQSCQKSLLTMFAFKPKAKLQR